MEKENFNPLVYDSRMSDVYTQDSTFGQLPSPFPHGGAPKSERKFANIAHNAEPDEKMTKLIQENFDLRLHCYHLKEKLDKVTNGADVSTDLNRVAYLESRVESLTRELDSKRRLLTEGSEALSVLDEQLKAVKLERDDALSCCAKLRDQLEGQISSGIAGASGASTSSGSGPQPPQQQQQAADLNEQRVSKMAGLLQGSWRRQHKLESRLASAEADAARLRELEAAAEQCGLELASLPDKVAELNKELAAANASLVEAGTVIETLESQLNESRAEIEELNQLLDEYRQEVASLNAEKAAAAAAAPVASEAANSSAGQRNNCDGLQNEGDIVDEAGSFWESVKLGALNRRSLTVGSLAAASGQGANVGSSQFGRSGGVSALVEGLGALSLMSTTAGSAAVDLDQQQQQQQQQLLGISAEAQQCLNASGRRFYHLCITSLASSSGGGGGGGTPSSSMGLQSAFAEKPTSAAAASNSVDFATEAATGDSNAAAATSAIGDADAVIDAELSVSDLVRDGMMDEVSKMRSELLPMSMNAAAGMTAAELGQLKSVFDRLLGQLRGAEAGLQAALSTTVGNVTALLGSASVFGGAGTRNSSTRLIGGEDNSFMMNQTAPALDGHQLRDTSIISGIGGGFACMYPPTTPGLRSMEEENALAMRNLQDHVAEVQQAMTGFGRIGCMLEALLAGAVAEASSFLIDDQDQQQQQQHHHRRRHHRHNHHHHRLSENLQRDLLLDTDPGADEWATPPSPPPSSAAPAQQPAPPGMSIASSLTNVTTCPGSSLVVGRGEGATTEAAAGAETVQDDEDQGAVFVTCGINPPSLRVSAMSAAAANPAARRPRDSELALTDLSCDQLSAQAEHDLRQELELAKQKIQQLEETLAKLKSTGTVNAELADSMKLKVEQLEAALDEKADQLEIADAAAVRVEQLEAALAERTDQLESVEAELQSAKITVDQVQTALAEKSAQLQAALAAELELESMKATIELIEAELSEKTAQLEAAKAAGNELLLLKSRIEDIEASLNEKTAQLESAEQQMESAADKVHKLETALAETTAQLESTEVELESAKVTVKLVEEAMAQKDAQLENFKTVELQLDSMKAKIEQFEADLVEKAAQLESAEFDLESAKEKSEQLETELVEKSSQLKTKESELESSMERMQQLEAVLTEKSAQLESAESELELLSEKVQQLESALVEKSTQIESAESDLELLSEKVQQLESALVEKTAQIESTESELESSQEKAKQIEAALTEKISQLESVQSELFVKTDEMQQMKATIVEKTAQLDSAFSELQSTKEKLRQMESNELDIREQYEEAKALADAVRVESDARQAELLALQAEISRLNAELETAKPVDNNQKSQELRSGQDRQQQQQQQRESHAAEMAEVLASYRELTNKCERAVSLSVELQSRAEELRAKLTSRTKRLEQAQKSNSQLKAMLKSSDDTCNQLSLELKATKLEIEDKTALTEKLLCYISRLGAPHPTVAADAAAATASVVSAGDFDDMVDASLSSTNRSSGNSTAANTTTATGSVAGTPLEAARACSPSPATGEAAAMSAAAAAVAAAAAWPEVIQAEMTLHDALARVSNCGFAAPSVNLAAGAASASADCSGPTALARELRRALRDLRHLRNRLADSLAESRQLAGRLAEVDSRADELSSLRRRVEQLTKENDAIKTAEFALPDPQHAICRLDSLELLRLEVAECRRTVDQAVNIVGGEQSSTSSPSPSVSRQLRRELAVAARCAHAAASILTKGFILQRPGNNHSCNDNNNSAVNDSKGDGLAANARLEAARAESRNLGRRVAAISSRLPVPIPVGDAAAFSDRLSATENLLARAKEHLLLAEFQQQQHNASL